MEEVSYPVDGTSIRTWTDDTIDVVRTRIGVALGVHSDRLRIYAKSELPADYYAKDSRKWEELFLRMSPDGAPIQKASIDILNTYTDPAWPFEDTYDKTAWMLLDRNRESSFTEYRVLGAPEDRSWVLPFDEVDPPYVPPPAKVSIEMRALLSSLHPKITGFKTIEHKEGLKPTLETLYYPFLRSGSPAIVQPDVARSITKQDDLLRILTERPSPQPTQQSVLRARWKIPLVDTDLGVATRNRFEQMFYGTTVSDKVLSLSFFGGRNEQSRHKFFAKEKSPAVDLRTWQYWWTAAKPSRNKPALLFFNGSSRFVYDRISMSATELVVSAHRTDESSSIESLQKHIKEWILSIDGLSAFVDPVDLDDTRWVLHDVSASLKYPKEMKEVDFRRFGCLRSIYEVVDHEKLLFKCLRADQTDIGLSAPELRVIQLLRENPTTSADDIAENLDVPVEEAAVYLGTVREKLEDMPDLLDKQFSNLPTFRLSASTVTVTYAIDLPRIAKYISILRDILMNPDDPSLDDVCPSRMETAETAEAELVPVEETTDDFLDDLLGEIAGVNVVAAPEVKEAPKQKKVQTKGAVTSLATYLLTQLREFDPETYDPDDPQILRKCDHPRQPIVLSTADMTRLDGTPYDPKTGPSAVLDVEGPDGAVICPPYWCTHDRIPLTKDQLVDNRCPVCSGQVRSTDKKIEKTQDIIAFPVIQRDSSIVFPGYVKYKSKKNGRAIPCCFTTAQTTKLSTRTDTLSTAEAFYVLGESKSKLNALRLGYVSKMVGRALGIPLKYKDTIAAGNRMQAGQAGFFRVGVGHAAETLPTLLGVAKIKSPIQNVDATMRCSFFRTWRGADEDADESIIPTHLTYKYRLAGRVASIDKAFKHGMLTSIEELEYAAIALDCQVFVLYEGESVEIGCFMGVGAVRSVNRSIAVVISNGDPEYISHVARVTTTPQFTANLHKASVFPPGILAKLTDLRKKACIGDSPTIDSTLTFVQSMASLKNRLPEMKVILDPYGRAQALFIPELIIVPFKPTSQIPTFLGERLTGYADIPTEELPYKPDMLDFLEEAQHIHAGFKYAHDIGNADGQVVELITASGLRIPVQADEWDDDYSEISETVRKAGEDALVWGDPDPRIQKSTRAITYEAEVFDFVLYQLSHDIHSGEEYRDMRMLLGENNPSVEALRPLLHAWIEATLAFHEADNPPSFVKKMRSPCSVGNCTGSLCYQDGASCRVEIKKVRPTLDRASLENRLLKTLVSNEKIRDIVWQNKSSPFFSSVLYLEMENELILSDSEVSTRLRS